MLHKDHSQERGKDVGKKWQKMVCSKNPEQVSALCCATTYWKYQNVEHGKIQTLSPWNVVSMKVVVIDLSCRLTKAAATTISG